MGRDARRPAPVGGAGASGARHCPALPLDPPSVEGFADAIAGDLTTGAVVIGHSLGGMVAEQNPATHRGAQRMAATIPGAHLAIMPGGHLLHIDNPLGLPRAIEGFLSHLPRPAGGTA